MHEQAFAALEYNQLRLLVRREAQTPMARQRAEALAPLSDFHGVHQALQAVSECVALRRRGMGWSFSEIADPTDALARLRIEGAVLEPLTILDTARLCEQAAAARSQVQAAREQCLVLWEIVAELPSDIRNLSARVFSKLLPNGDIDDRASPELGRIRADITRMRSDVTRSLERLMRRSEEAIQDQLVTMRNDRFVIPVKADHRGRVVGVAHGSSSSGATVFIEPLETIEANNDLQVLRDEEAREVTRILATLTEELRNQYPAIERAAQVVANLDFIAAKAALARRFNCVEPQVSEHESALELREARHPLLEENLRAVGGAVVPISFALAGEHSIMVISGANAGGKTVVLKTAGLLALMALSGLHVPAEQARIPLYRSVLADIGDQQSLAANLSTFTAHVANIRRMIELCQGAPALVLLDEVGTGTDPEEGSALGVAVVDHFRHRCGAHVIATTHYSGLKMYAANDDGVLNASVEFNEQTLEPTYKLIVGVAGSSSGVEIARRFGFPEEIVQAAHKRVNEATRDAAEYLQRIKREAEAAQQLRQALEEERSAVAEKYAALDLAAQAIERELQQAFEHQLRTAVTDFENRSRELFSKIEDRVERARVERDAARRVAELRRETQQRAAAQSPKTLRSPLSRASNVPVSMEDARNLVRHHPRSGERGRAKDFAEPIAAAAAETDAASQQAEVLPNIEPGVQVRVLTLNTTGVIERLSGSDTAEVRVGAMRFREKLSNLEALPLPSPSQGAANKRGAQLQSRLSSGTEVRLRQQSTEEDFGAEELNIIGRTTDEAADLADKFLDEAYLHSLQRVRIVHGHGTGALRRMIANLLRGHPHVASFTPAPPDQGGAGATLVELKQ